MYIDDSVMCRCVDENFHNILHKLIIGRLIKNGWTEGFVSNMGKGAPQLTQRLEDCTKSIVNKLYVRMYTG